MPCNDTTSQISILLDNKDHLLSFEYYKATCNKEIGGSTGFLDYCVGKSIDALAELEFDVLIKVLGLSNTEKQFLLFLEWSALTAALDQYQGRWEPSKEDRYQVATITYASDQVEIIQRVLAPLEMPKIIPCRKR